MDQNNDMPRTVLNQFIKTVQEKTERAALSRGEGFGLFVGRRIPTVKNLDQVAFNDLILIKPHGRRSAPAVK